MFPRHAIAAATAIIAVAAAGCGVGEGEARPGQATLTVTRDHGAEQLLHGTLEEPTEADTVVRFLDREADIETDYGGNFVSSIEGFSGTVEAGRSRDWFFYVNGYWSPLGAAEATVRPGDRIWWDYRDWSSAYRVPAVIGSWPEPFLSGKDGRRFDVEVVCFELRDACQSVADRLEAEGVERVETSGPDSASSTAETLRILVGPWSEVRTDPTARTLEAGPGNSGVYAEPRRCDGGWALSVLSDRGEEAHSLARAGWVAAVQRGDDQPTWIVSGTEAASASAASELLDESKLAEHYAIVMSGGETLRAPAPAGETPIKQGECP